MRDKKATTAGFEPARAKPSRFLVCLLNHSDKLSWCFRLIYSIKQSDFIFINNSTSLIILLSFFIHILINQVIFNSHFFSHHYHSFGWIMVNEKVTIWIIVFRSRKFEYRMFGSYVFLWMIMMNLILVQ